MKTGAPEDRQRASSRSDAAAPAALMQTLRQASAWHQQGRLTDAERLYREVLAQIPSHPDALHFLGLLEAQRGDKKAGLALIDRAIAANPGNASAHYNRANLLAEAGRFDDAVAGFDRVVALRPDHIGAWHNRGVYLQQLRRFAEAVRSYDKVLEREPDHAAASFGRGNALIELGRTDDALVSFERACRLAPQNAQGLNNFGHALGVAGRYDEARTQLEKAIALDPKHPEMFANLGNVYAHQRRFADAAEAYGRALALRPDQVESLSGLGYALTELKQHDAAIGAFERLLALKPDYPYAAGMLLYARTSACDWRGLDALSESTIAAVRAGKRAVTPIALFAVSDSEADHARAAEIVITDKHQAPETPLWRGEIYRHERIRIAYVSADFNAHAVATLMAGVFEHHDRARFETIAISHGHDDNSAMRARLMRAFDRFLDVRGKGDAEIAALIRELQADIAVDLTGLTGSGRPGIFKFRPAPVQAQHLGFAGSMGAPYYDYVLADRIVIPPGNTLHFKEQVVYLPDSYLPNDRRRVRPDASQSRSAWGLPEHGFVFAAFNNSYKFAPRIFDIWMRLLHTVENSVLWLAQSNATACRNLAREAEQRGIAANRLVFAPYAASEAVHLGRLALADLFLDTLPYNAHATAADALWAGLPVLTCEGASFPARVAASLLQAVSLPELIAPSLADYEARAIALARDPAALIDMRARLATAREHAPLFGTARFTKHLESAYSTMAQRQRRGLKPEGFAIEAPST